MSSMDSNHSENVSLKKVMLKKCSWGVEEELKLEAKELEEIEMKKEAVIEIVVENDEYEIAEFSSLFLIQVCYSMFMFYFR